MMTADTSLVSEMCFMYLSCECAGCVDDRWWKIQTYYCNKLIFPKLGKVKSRWDAHTQFYVECFVYEMRFVLTVFFVSLFSRQCELDLNFFELLPK